MQIFTVLSAIIFTSFVVAKDVIITVGGNTTSNPGAVFKPQQVVANVGDRVIFNFTQGNHSAIQSTFASPCTPAFFTNNSINGFNSGFRDAGNGTAVTQLPVDITSNTTTIWFYDANLCALGGVGGININDSSTETLDGFSRNAVRLNGTDSNTTSTTGTSSGATSTQTSPGGSATTTQSSPSTGSAVERSILSSIVAVPLLVLGTLLSL